MNLRPINVIGLYIPDALPLGLHHKSLANLHPDWNRISLAVREYDNHTCCLCGEKGTEAHEHWKINFATLDHNFEIQTAYAYVDNIFTVCKLCHNLFHMGRTATLHGSVVINTINQIHKIDKLHNTNLCNGMAFAKLFEDFIERSNNVIRFVNQDKTIYNVDLSNDSTTKEIVEFFLKRR